jgi:hypothetical protein
MGIARRFVWKAMLFVLIGAGLAIPLQSGLVLGLTRYSASARGVWNAVVKGKVNTDIIVCGSSRALVHYNPAIIANETGLSTFNLGRNGTFVDLQLSFLKTYLAHNKAPRCIIQNLDNSCFKTTRQIFEPAQYIPYLNEPALYERLITLDPGYQRMRRIPLLGIIENRLLLTSLAGLAGVYPKEDHFNGFRPTDRPWTGEFERFKESHPNGAMLAMEDKGVEIFRELIECSLKSGAKVVLVYSPEYKEVQPLFKNREEVFRKIRDIATEYKVVFWDFSDDPICSDRSLFYNSQHLNSRGANLFSIEVGKKLKSFCDTRALVTKSNSADEPPYGDARRER